MSETKGKLTRKDLFGVWFRWMNFCHACYNYEVYQGIGFAHAMSYALKKFYPNKADLGRELSKHTVFFNTSTHIGGLTHGAVLALEENRANGNQEVTPELINSIKAGLMGPLAGIGDSVVQGIIVPIYLAIGILLTENLGAIGTVIYIVAVSATVLGIAYFSFAQGYKYGSEAVSSFVSGGMMQKLLGFAGILGTMVLGGLVSRYVNITSALRLKVGTADFVLQTDFLDKLMPNFLSIGVTVFIFYLLRKGVKSDALILWVFVAGIILALLGILGPVPVKG